MKKGFSFAAAAIAFVLSAVLAASAAEPNMTEGMWEIKGEMKIEGMPFSIPPVVTSQCLTKKDMVPQQKQKNSDCTLVKSSIRGNTVEWEMKCTDTKGSVTDSTGTVTYSGTSFDGTMHMVTTDKKGSKSESNMKMSGKRIGDCK